MASRLQTAFSLKQLDRTHLLVLIRSSRFLHCFLSVGGGGRGVRHTTHTRHSVVAVERYQEPGKYQRLYKDAAKKVDHVKCALTSVNVSTVSRVSA